MKISTAATTALRVLAAAAILAGCSNGSQSAFSPASPMQAINVTSAATGSRVTLLENNMNKTSAHPAGENNYGCRNAQIMNFWQGPIGNTAHGQPYYYEYNGLAYFNNTSPPTWTPCGDDHYVGEWIGGVPWYAYHFCCWWGTAVSAEKVCAACFLTSDYSSDLIVLQAQGKNSHTTLNTVETLSTCSTCASAGVAAGSDGSVFASVQSDYGSQLQSGVYVYAPGATSPTTILQGPTDLAAGGVAVDANHDVYWTANAFTTSGTTGEIFEFPYSASGYGGPNLLMKTRAVGGILFTSIGKGKHAVDYLVVSNPTAGNIALLNLRASGSVKYIQTGGNPAGISLDSTGKQITVSDPTNNTVSIYSFPRGTLLRSAKVQLGSASYPDTVTGAAPATSSKS